MSALETVRLPQFLRADLICTAFGVIDVWQAEGRQPEISLVLLSFGRAFISPLSRCFIG